MTQWQFDAQVAKNFVDHARQHIPNYQTVIAKSVAVCTKLCTLDASIIDVGCATGETLRQLQAAGFTNLTGVDASKAMLEHCTDIKASIIHSSTFPDKKFDAIICNWTLHFIPDKLAYLKDIRDHLNPDGFVILSDKTSTDTLAIEFYHDFKANAGVDQKAIADKAEQVKDIMFIHGPEWYLTTLKALQFKQVLIIDASWCFTSFLCVI